MTKEDLHHWQDTPEEIKKCEDLYQKIEAAGLVEDLFYLIEKKMNDFSMDESYNKTDFS